jgi:hypothetical protein
MNMRRYSLGSVIKTAKMVYLFIRLVREGDDCVSLAFDVNKEKVKVKDYPFFTSVTPKCHQMTTFI